DNGQKLMIQGVYQEHRFRPGVMEFQIQNIMLLDQVRKSLTKKLYLGMPLDKLDEEMVQFIETNLKGHPGNTDVIIQVVDTEGEMAVKLKTHSQRLEINDELINYLYEHETVKYSLDVA